MEKSNEINELATALSKAQSEMSNATKSSNNPFFKSKYADLAEIINTVKDVFGKYGLSVMQHPSYDSGVVSVTTILMHSSGQWSSSQMKCPVVKQDPQGVGSVVTYCRRYALSGIAGVAQEDDDANAGSGKTQDETKKNKTPFKPKLIDDDTPDQLEHDAMKTMEVPKVPSSLDDIKKIPHVFTSKIAGLRIFHNRIIGDDINNEQLDDLYKQCKHLRTWFKTDIGIAWMDAICQKIDVMVNGVAK